MGTSSPRLCIIPKLFLIGSISRLDPSHSLFPIRTTLLRYVVCCCKATERRRKWLVASSPNYNLSIHWMATNGAVCVDTSQNMILLSLFTLLFFDYVWPLSNRRLRTLGVLCKCNFRQLVYFSFGKGEMSLGNNKGSRRFGCLMRSRSSPLPIAGVYVHYGRDLMI